MDRDYEVIVIGCGGLGSAALYRLSRELGPAVLGVEQFRLGHERVAGPLYKFAGLIGRILSELALDGESTFPIEALRLERAAVSDDAFEKTLHA